MEHLFNNLSSQDKEEIMKELTDEYQSLKENYTGAFKLRQCNDEYDIVANLLIAEIDEGDKFELEETIFCASQYHSELFAKTPIGVQFVEDYLNGIVFFYKEDKKEKYLSDKRKLRRKKQLPYIIIAIAIGLLFLCIMYL